MFNRQISFLAVCKLLEAESEVSGLMMVVMGCFDVGTIIALKSGRKSSVG